MRRIPSHLLVLALLGAVALLASGFVTQWTVRIWTGHPLGVLSNGLTVLGIGAYQGGVGVYLEVCPSNAHAHMFHKRGVLTFGTDAGIELEVHHKRADLKHSLWEFSANRAQAPPIVTIWDVQFPIWCLLVPCVAALIFLHRRRRRQIGGRGFAVEELETGLN